MRFAFALVALGLVSGCASLSGGEDQPANAVAYVNGHWWDGKTFVSRTMYVEDGVFEDGAKRRVGRTIDLAGAYVTPPLAEGHNHWLEAQAVDQYNACYLADGVFYVRDLANIPYVYEQFRDKVNTPTSVDFVTAMTGFTGPGAHPVEVLDQFVGFGILPGDWKPDYDKHGQFVVESEADIDERMKLLMLQKPALVKAFLGFSERYETSLKDPATRGQGRGMNPKLLPYLVRRAHEAGLPVAVHVYTAADFRNAVASGADEIAHFPGTGYSLGRSDDVYTITAEDARAAKRAGAKVHSTLGWLTAMAAEDPAQAKAAREEVVIPNLKLLHEAGVPILFGSDQFRQTVAPEIGVVASLGVLSNAEILRIATHDTPRAVFPKRKIGVLADGYEASFIALKGDPLRTLDHLREISLRVKQGEEIIVPDAMTHRAGASCIE